MQNNTTGMVSTSVPVAVVPNPPRWPSWKIHTSAPNAAVNDKPLSSNVFSGSTALPVSPEHHHEGDQGDDGQHERQPGGDGIGGVPVHLGDATSSIPAGRSGLQ